MCLSNSDIVFFIMKIRIIELCYLYSSIMCVPAYVFMYYKTATHMLLKEGKVKERRESKLITLLKGTLHTFQTCTCCFHSEVFLSTHV